MQIEIFECTETAAEPVDASAEAYALIEELGLTGQRQLVCPAKAEGQVTRFPYREMLADETAVYSTLCPLATRIGDYSATTIPLRVLQIAAHAKSLMPSLYLHVWDREAAAIKDPVLVAETSDYAWQTGFKRFILARWGEVLEPFAVLMKRAADARRESLKADARKVSLSVEAASDAEILSKGDSISW